MSAVLIVDDSPADRALFRTLLSRAGHTVHEVARGKEALVKARRSARTPSFSTSTFPTRTAIRSAAQSAPTPNSPACPSSCSRFATTTPTS